MTVVPGSIPRIILSSAIKIASLVKTSKNQRILFLLLKLLLAAAVAIIIYLQLQGVTQDQWDNFGLKSPLFLILAVVLVYPNMYVAYLKWKLILNTMDLKDKDKAVQSFFAGLVAGILTPNMAGNFLGRMMYYKRLYRVRLIILTVIGNYAQLLATVGLGIIAVVVLDTDMLPGNRWGWIAFLGSGVFFSFALYYLLAWFLKITRRWQKRRKNRTLEILKEYPFIRTKLLGWALVRFVIFSLQFCCMLIAFGEEPSITMLLAIWQVYFYTMLVPGFVLGKLGVKEMVALPILTAIEMNEFSIIFASLLIWFINTLSPALLGLIIFKRPQVK